MATKKQQHWFWPATCLLLAGALASTLWTNHLLRENASVYRQALDIQTQWCDGLGEVNQLCEQSMVDLASRLGLGTDWAPLVSTALWKRATGNMGIAKARKKLHAPKQQNALPMGWPEVEDANLAGIGGGLESDE